VPIVFTGLRPGEKLHEELMSDVERTVPTSVAKIRVVQTDEPDPGAVRSGLERLAAAVAMATREDILTAIRLMVPECVEPLRRPEWSAPRFVPVGVIRRKDGSVSDAARPLTVVRGE
jgi:FlaA1/EpsC-like NDP-sugar epimerase